MKKITLLSFCIISFTNIIAQQRYDLKIEHIKGQEIICPARYVDEPSFVDMSEAVKKRLNNKNARPGETKGATIIVNYVDFPANAKAAFQRAIDIWSETLSSTVPIRVNAFWQPLGKNILGSANASDFLRNFPGAKVPNVFYPMALAEKMAGRELNSINDEDIFCRFSSEIPWYFGSANTVPLGQFDFTSIVLHELGHGLGFVSSMRVSGGQGSYGFGTRFNAIYDSFLKDGTGKLLTDTLAFKNPSAVLRTTLVSEDIFFDSPKTKSTIADNKVLIYAPNPYEPGSSISHLDDDKYGAGGINSLMTPTASLREKNLNPGPLVVKMFEDMGWKGTSVIHDPIKDLLKADKIKLEALIISDTTFVASSAKVFYAFNNGGASKATEISLTKDNVTGKFFTDLVIPANTTQVDYYFEVKDNFGEIVKSPGNGGFTDGSGVWGFDIGKKDLYGPEIEHFAPEILLSASPVSLIANVEDDFQEGVDTVYVAYSINGAAKPSIGLKKFNILTDNKLFSQGGKDKLAFLAENGIKDLKVGDKVKYQIIALDKSKNKTTIPTVYTGLNQKDKPTETFYEFLVTEPKKSTALQYTSDFETTNDDFALLGFNVSQPEGFTNKSLNSSHPYTNGYGVLDKDELPFTSFDKNEIAMLRVPITLKKDSAVISFDEVVLVEPGEPGARYGSSDFFDYVVVEGSLDGDFWFPLESGYDSNRDSDWTKAFTGSLSSGTAANSLAKGTPALIKKREINIYGTDFDKSQAGKNLLIRFRLYADQWTSGWGWSIDNLFIQKVKPVILSNQISENKNKLSLFPNPTSQLLKVNYEVSGSQDVNLEIFSFRGSIVYQEKVPVVGTTLQHDINIGNLPAGTYILRMSEKRGQVVKRFVISGTK